MENQHFAEIILPLALPGTFTYHLTSDEFNQLKVGQRVAVPFGSNKLYTGIIHSFHRNKPELYRTKGIHSILDDYALVTENQIRFWEWMADYYLCPLGDVFRNAFPAALKWESETFVRLSGVANGEDIELNETEQTVIKILNQKGVASVKEISGLIEQSSVIKIIKSLWEKGLLEFDELIKEKYTPKIERFLRINPDLKSDEKFFNESLSKLKNASRQREFLLKLLVEESQNSNPVKVSKFLKSTQTNRSVLNSLAEKKMIEIYNLQTSRITEDEVEKEEKKQLTMEQSDAVKSISRFFESDKPVLLKGITSSGKTEIYIRIIEQTLKVNKSVLFLLPEISLTSQMVRRIRKHFGEITGVYHSKFNQNERVEIWQKIQNGTYRIVLGTRSAVFLPFQELGLIIVDEEHENTYKQTDSKPYFQARDMALVLAESFKAKVLLGSSTPSLETYYNSVNFKFGLVELRHRYGEAVLPEIELIDLRAALKQKNITGDISHQLRDEIRLKLKEGKQVIVFQNRRGFAPVVECLSCGYTPFCPNCDVALTFHKSSNQLKCHYCGHVQSRPLKCANCRSTELTTKGIGTQQIEAQLGSLFPESKIARMDVDAMRRKFAYEKIIEAFEQREIDILVGTQMVAKGLDFSNVGLVGVIRADTLLNYPDFRAHERAFQLLAQVAGRAGRRNEQGKVLIQTFNPEHPVLQNVTTYDYENTVKDILVERKSFLYPPYLRLIQLTFRHAKKEKVEKVSVGFVKLLQPYFDEKHLLGPEEPAIGRIRNQFIRNVLIKIPPEKSAKSIKKLIQNKIEVLHTVSAFRSVKIQIDVDPY